jgi:exodeoxyribonuclease V alpha subunit
MDVEPLLKIIMARRGIDAFDLMLGQKIQQGNGCWLGVYISRAFRQGHMAVSIGGSLFPAVRGVFSDDGVPVLDGEEEKAIEQRIRHERMDLPRQLTSEGDMVALPYAHAVEVRLAKEVKRLSAALPYIQVESLGSVENLNEGQRAAVIGSKDASFCLVTGGPGTGKTHTAGVFLRALANGSKIRPLRVAVVAPTGRAVQTLFASISKNLEDEVALEAKTIHSLVCSASKTYLPYHAVIIDEGSMIGSDLMLRLLQRLHTGTRVMILGDPDQLPSVDPGQPFFELLKAAEGGVIRHFALHGSQRTTSKNLLEIASCVRRGDCEAFEGWLLGKKSDISFIECKSSDDWKKVETIIDREVIAPWRRELSMEEAVALLRQSAFLTPCRRGYWGTESVNERAGRQKAFTPVVCTKNSHHLGVMNGDLGVLQRGLPFDKIHFHHCTVPTVLLPRLEKAFAMTVHKSQGGEFRTVAVLIPPRALLDRRLLYTAITRAKERLVIIGQKEDVIGAVARKEDRLSALAGLLRGKTYGGDFAQVK